MRECAAAGATVCGRAAHDDRPWTPRILGQTHGATHAPSAAIAADQRDHPHRSRSAGRSVTEARHTTLDRVGIEAPGEQRQPGEQRAEHGQHPEQPPVAGPGRAGDQGERPGQQARAQHRARDGGREAGGLPREQLRDLLIAAFGAALLSAQQIDPHIELQRTG
jgi:hypothetical protein